MSSTEAGSLLRQIAKKSENGEIALEQGKKKVNLSIPPRVEVEVKAQKETGKKKTTMKLEVEIEWLPEGGKVPAEPMKIGWIRNKKRLTVERSASASLSACEEATMLSRVHAGCNRHGHLLQPHQPRRKPLVPDPHLKTLCS